MITTHVLDTSRGRPAAGLAVRLERYHEGGQTEVLGWGTTDVDGRVRSILPPGSGLTQGPHRLVFETGTYFAETGVTGFFPEVVITFEVREASQHHHVPLLLSPYGYSTYRGS